MTAFRMHVRILIAVALLLLADNAVAQEAQPELRAIRLAPDQRIELDGLLSEAVWQTAPPATGFRQREPDEGAPASEETEVRVLYDESTLYVGILARDSDPQRIISRILQRDRVMEPQFAGSPGFAGDDGVAILFDPFHDHRNAVIFATNPNGAEFDGLLTDESEFNVDWRGIWEVRAQRVAEGWSAEFAIPFRTLRYPPDADGALWGFNVFRVIRRKNEEVLWTAWSRDNEGFARVSRAGHLAGMHGLPRSTTNLDVKPFLLVGATDVPAAGASDETDARGDFGVDLKYEVRPGLVLDVTANTDFAQVEADDRQINLTRFDLFFPEKRDFFIENAGIFEFGARGFGGPPPFLLFFSRRIGLSEDGEVPVLGGARLSGRAGDQTVGVLNVVTDEAFDVPRTNFSVARIKRDVGGNGYFGAMLTDRRTGDAWNTGGGVDVSLWPTARLNLAGFAARTFTSGVGGEGNAYRAEADYTADRFGFNFSHLAIGPGANAAMGFITRTDVRYSSGYMRVTLRPTVLGLRSARISSRGEYVTDTDNRLQDWNAGPGVIFAWSSGESVNLDVDSRFSRVREPFRLGGRIPVGVGDYDGSGFSVSASSAAHRAVAGGLRYDVENNFGGRIVNRSAAVTLTPGSHLATTLGFTHGTADLPAGEFDARIASLRLAYAFNTRLAANALVQCGRIRGVDAEPWTCGTNLRLGLVHRPGSDLFIVFNEQRGGAGTLSRIDSRGVVAKLTWLLRI